MRSSELARTTWRKSNRSNDGVDGACIEVAELADHVVLRDSKHPAGLVLAFSYTEWRAFLADVRTGQLD